MDKEITMRLVFASNNAHKLSEVREIMPAGIEVLSLREVGFEAEIDETGTTLAENSAIKAHTVYQWLQDHMAKEQMASGFGVFADDTGLEIDALDGAPGVYTARWYRLGADAAQCPQCQNETEVFAANRAKALRELNGKANRHAQFKTVITLITPAQEIQVEGIVRGQIATKEHGKGGFGYDPLFIPEGYDQTFGELPVEIKNSISHRARALEKLAEVLKTYPD